MDIISRILESKSFASTGISVLYIACFANRDDEMNADNLMNETNAIQAFFQTSTKKP